MESENKGGRPLMIKTPEEMQEKIDKYFDDCMGEILYDEDGDPRTDKYGNIIVMGAKPPTITGLALAIGFNSRQALLNYQGREEFNDTITKAKSRVEEYAETRLFDRDGANGAKFALANNFSGWREKKEIEADVKAETTIVIELTDDDED